jgi:hypothetical protein
MKRRDFLASSATLTGAALLTQGCNQPGSKQAPPGPPPAGPTDAQRSSAVKEQVQEALTATGRAARRNRPEERDKAPKEETGLEVIYHGLCLFVMPPPKSATKQVDVAFINTRLNKALKRLVHIHTPTLRVEKLDVHHNSDAVPGGSDDKFSYYTLKGPVQMIGTNTPELSDWGAPPNLKVNDVPLARPNPSPCPGGTVWNNMAWVLDFKELEPSARLPKPAKGTWREAEEFTGVLSIRDGFLETDECPVDNEERYSYDVNGATRVLKEHVRHFVRSKEFAYVQFKFGTEPNATSLILKNNVEKKSVGVDVFHLPTPGMVVTGTAPLTDYFAVYDALVETSTLTRLGPPERRTTLRARVDVSCDTVATPNSSNCAPLRITGGG